MAKDPELNKLKESFLSDLKKLLENKDKKEAKELQAKAEDLFGEFKQNVSHYLKTKSKELEQANQKKEEQVIKELDDKLNQI